MQIKSSTKMQLLDLLQEMAPDSTKNTLRNWLSMGRVVVDDRVEKNARHLVEKGQIVKVEQKRKTLQQGLKIVWEDTELIVVEKPPGLLTVATEKETEQTVHAYLKRYAYPRRVYPIHRLDRESSGLLVFAFREKTRDHLKKQLEKREMKREYRAVVHGYPKKGTWRCHLRENVCFEVFVCPPSKGKEAITHFETVERRGDLSLLKLHLETGRKHQIRVQAANAGFPLVGDNKYGLEEDGHKRLHLHAVALTFFHPIRGKKLHFTSAPFFESL